MMRPITKVMIINKYNVATAIGFMGNRIYEIDMEGNIWLVRNMSKSDFLNKEQPMDEVNKRFKFLIYINKK